MDKYTFKKLEEKQNKYTYEVTVEYSSYQLYEDAAFLDASKKVKVAGFRPGKAPKEMIEKDLQSSVFTKAINKLLPQVAYEVMTKEDLNPISELDYELKEFDKEKGVIFTFTLYTQPKIDAEKFKKINVKYEELIITDEEVVQVIKNMIRNNLPKEKLQVKNEKLKEDESTMEAESKEVDVKSANAVEDGGKEESKKIEEIDFDITDELVKELNYDGETTYEGLKKKIKEALAEMRKQQNESDFTAKVVDEAVKLADFDLPHAMIHGEMERMESDFRSRLKQIKLNEENYLKTQGTTIEAMREKWEEDAKVQLSADLMLINLAVQEKLVPTEDDVEKELEKIDNPQVRSQYKSARNRDYLRTLMTRDRGLKKLIEIVKSK